MVVRVGDVSVSNGAFDDGHIESERAKSKITFFSLQTKAFCLAQGDEWSLSSAKRLNGEDKAVRQGAVSCKRLPTKKAGQR